MKLNMSLYILSTLTSIAQLHSCKVFTENNGKFPLDMRGRYDRHTVLANEDIKKIIAWLHSKH